MNNYSSSNGTNVPEAKSAMNKFKMEVANEIGVPLSDGYNGH
ncbi:MAG: alpha/beta-type small acid-soluble spore protein [Lachnospiraceae bacterium]|nr:alpha/beta-type small acid-soluble spore protein [Lachnospiraceae bacterium]